MRTAVACIVLAASTAACLLAYSSYDSRFQTQSSDGGSLVPIVIEDADAGAIGSIAVTTNNILYAFGNDIKIAPIAGGAGTVWRSAGAQPAAFIVSDGASSVAWLSGNNLVRADVSTPTVTTTIWTGNPGLGRVAADGTHVAWVQGGATSTVANVASWGGGSPVPLALPTTGTPADVVVDQQGVTAFSQGVGVARFEVDGGLMCAMHAGIYEEQKTSTHGIAMGSTGSPFFEVDTNRGLERYPNPCTDAGTAVAPSSALVNDVMADDSRVYWVANHAAIGSAPFDGGATEMVTPQVPGIVSMTHDASFIYFATSDAIYRVAKPK